MKLSILFLLFFLVCGQAQANEIFQLRQWRAFENVDTVLGEKGCVAETIKEVELPSGDKENWVLQVIKLQTPDRDHSFPIVVAYPEQDPGVDYYEATAQSNVSDVFSLTLLQPKSGGQGLVANRLMDRNRLVNHIKSDNSFAVSFLSKDETVRTVDYSLSGSSRTITAMMETCQ